MKINIAIDKKAEAVIDEKLCVNCGKCGEVCPTEAVEEYRKTVYCMFPDCGEGKGADLPAKTFREAKNFALRSSCSMGCPLGIIPQAITSLVKCGDIDGAYRLIDEKNPMPWVCASVCDHACQNFCLRGAMLDEPINMKALEGYILSRADIRPYKHIRRYSERIAVIGGGAAGLTAAFDLSEKGYDVTVFERDGKLGGMLNWGVPDFRLDKEKLKAETERMVSAGIQVRYHSVIGEDRSLDDLREEGFSACLLAVGASVGVKPDIKGSDAEMVYDGVKLMRQINGGEDEGIALGDNIVVVGDGELAVDISGTLARMGKSVVCAISDISEDRSVDEDTIEALRGAGVDVKTSVRPKQIIREQNKAKAVEFIKEGHQENENGTLKTYDIKGSEFNAFCDTVVFALGQHCSVEKIGNMETYPDGRVRVDDRYRTNKEMVFACGDAIYETGSVAEAMASGRAAAKEIHEALKGIKEREREHPVKNAPDVSIIYPANVQNIAPQYEKTLYEGDDGTDNEVRYAEDIAGVLRDAGIKEEMRRFSYKDASGTPKRKVAVIGGGIAGITAALDLAEAGYRPVIFEKYPGLGGSYRWFSSDKRIDKDLLKRELEKINDSGIETICNISAGKKPDISALKDAGYEAVLFAIGETYGVKPDIGNADCRGVFEMTALMSRITDCEIPDGIGRQVIVTGSDDMTFDAARVLKSCCGQVTVLSPMSKGKLKAGVGSVMAALDDGVNLVTGVRITNINEENGAVQSVNGRVMERGITIDIPCDTVVFGEIKRPDTYAISLKNPKLDIDDRGYIQADERLVTSMYGVFATGDTDMSSVDAGHAGAATVKSFMESTEIMKQTDKPAQESDMSGAAVKYEIFEGKTPEPLGFGTGRKLFDDKQAFTEASRCLGCGYHKEIGENCIGCGMCAMVCPSKAITMKAIDEEDVRAGGKNDGGAGAGINAVGAGVRFDAAGAGTSFGGAENRDRHAGMKGKEV